MRRIYFLTALLMFIGQVNAQYCTPAFASGCGGGDEINSFSIPSAGFSHLNTGCSPGAYGDYTSQTITLEIGTPYTFTVTHNFGSQQVRIWADFDNDQIFTNAAPELIAMGSSASVGGVNTTTGSITIPGTVAPGTYRMRVGNRYSSQPVPCNTDGYGEAHDYTLMVTAPACWVPSSPVAGTPGLTTVSLSWTAASTAPAEGYEVYYSTSNTPPTPTTVLDATNSTTSMTPSADLTGLSPSSVYFAWVRSSCSATVKSAWVGPVSFTTMCAPLTTMSENFDAYATGSIVPICWARIVPATDAGSQTITATTPASGLRNIYQYASTSQNPVIVVLPEYSNVAAGTHWLKFKARVTTAPGALEVGYVTDPTDASSFVNLQTLDITNTSYNSSYYSVVIPNFIPANARLAVKNPSDDKSYYWDDVIWEATPTCFPPTGVTFTGHTTSSVTVNWVAPATAPANGYEVYYSTSNTAPTATTVLDATNSATSTSLFAAINGLSSGTQYYVWVRSVCSASDKSPWSIPYMVTTPCTTFSLPYAIDFENATIPEMPVCTVRENVGSGNNWTTSSPNAYGFTTKVLTYIYNSSNPANAWFHTGGVNLTAGTSYRVYFKYAKNTTGYTEKLKITYGTAQDAATQTNVIHDYTAVPDISSAVQTYHDFTPSVSGVYYLGFNVYSDSNQYNLYIDDILIMESPTCIEPTAVTVSAITTGGASISFTPPSVVPGNGYQVYYSTSNTAPTASTVLDATNSVTAPTSPATLTGLNPATTYYVWVRSDCGGGNLSMWSVSSSFTTSCVLVTEFSENFNATAVNALPSCWAKLTTGASANAYVQASTAMSSPNALYVYGDSSSSNVYVTMPQVSTLSSGNYRLRFKARANFTAGGILEIGYMSNPTDHTTFTALGTYTSSSNTAIDNYSLNITGVPAGITTLALRHTGAPAYSILVDDVIYEPVPGCGDVTALTASNPTLNGADLMWTAPSTAPAGGYEIYYSTLATPPTASTVLDASNSFTSPTVGMTTTGMASATTYYVWVRSVCSPTEKGAWSNVATFSTLCNATGVPYEMNFNNAVVPAMPACGIVANGGTGNNWTTAAAPTDSSGFNSQVLRYAYHSTQAADAWFFTQGINMTAGTTYYISYKYGNNSTFFEEKMKVAVGNGASPSAMLPANGGTQIADYPSIMTGQAVSVNNLTFTPTTSGVYYVGFHAYSDANEYYLYLDDIQVTASALSTSEIKADAKDVRVYPNPFTDVINISDAKDLKSVSVIDASGRMVKTIASPQAQIRLGDLKSGLYILKLDYKDGTVKTVKVIKK
ncbi:T9SS type A sorting domain-containing protein [Chryseobacterium lacus]|uniref:T9SS C-terminal target domain-containing protein n=1 Tax=Chryseobacterium lacus TaxID=2058346 RepID=A0A368MVY4_9FLAO|nr:fibronectin type III domain-containing protein [Chryseobacterium lacus]RCU42387.1 T9SS C-terminal target domain-containing protein [Chryseobacterium lacus]RST26943.1 T9SS type A sorting domain-containing protein [Chryseobacterium lacus]